MTKKLEDKNLSELISDVENLGWQQYSPIAFGRDYLIKWDLASDFQGGFYFSIPPYWTECSDFEMNSWYGETPEKAILSFFKYLKKIDKPKNIVFDYSEGAENEW